MGEDEFFLFFFSGSPFGWLSGSGVAPFGVDVFKGEFWVFSRVSGKMRLIGTASMDEQPGELGTFSLHFKKLTGEGGGAGGVLSTAR